MPTYDYACQKCEHRFEVFHSIRDDAPRRCPKCRGKAKRVPSGGAGLLFKGSGFYITDYRSDNYRKGAKQEKGGAAGAGESKSGGAGESKSGGAGESKSGGAGESKSGGTGESKSGGSGESKSGGSGDRKGGSAGGKKRGGD